jgi:hypothetical protein
LRKKLSVFQQSHYLENFIQQAEARRTFPTRWPTRAISPSVRRTAELVEQVRHTDACILSGLARSTLLAMANQL